MLVTYVCACASLCGSSWLPVHHHAVRTLRQLVHSEIYGKTLLEGA